MTMGSDIVEATPKQQWRVIAASVQGTSHLRTTTPCQDAYLSRRLPSGDLLLAVADGAGSTQHGGNGAQVAVSVALDTIQEALTKYRPTSRKAWHVLMHHAFKQAREQIDIEAAAAAHPTRDYAATLIVLIATAEQTICGLVGDCAAVVQWVDGDLASLCPPQQGEYANMTNFVIQKNLSSVLDIQISSAPIHAAALFSDGLTPLAMNLAQNQPYSPFFEPLFAFLNVADNSEIAVSQLATFLNSARVNARTDDDKTLILAQRLR